jgi:hypothetical protein
MHRLLYTATAVLVLVAAVSVITHSANGVIGTTTTAPARGYYLTKNTITGGNVLTACATGYHFASVWEILVTSDLHYSKTLGRTNTNSGVGPPTVSGNSTFSNAAYGWIRTGGPADPNCLNWTSSNSVDSGSAGALSFGAVHEPQWIIDNGTSTQTAISCDGTLSGTPLTIGVWCVQN